MKTDSERMNEELMFGCVSEEMIAVRLKDFFPLLKDAMLKNRAFLQDLAEDKMHITRDVYEVLIAYKRCSVGEAA